MNDVLKRLQIWAASKCDGEWEHSHQINISALDNPGWSIEIDCDHPDREPFNLGSRDVDDWIEIEVLRGRVMACCDVNSLSRTLRLILDMICAP